MDERRDEKEMTADGEPMIDRAQQRQRRRRRARLRALRRLLVLALLVGLFWVCYTHWDTLAPDKLLARLQDSMNDKGGGFPVDISGANVHVLDRSQSYLVALGDSYLTFYSAAGREMGRYSCTYSAPLLRTAGKYVLLAEQGGRRLQLLTRTMSLCEVTAQQKILSVSLCENGRFAVLMQGETGYAVRVTVYDRQGKAVYSRSRSRQATAVTLSPSGDRLALLSVEAVNGVLDTVAETFDLSSSSPDALTAHTANDTLFYRAQLWSDRLICVGEDGLTVLPTDGSAALTYPAGDRRLIGCSIGSRTVALVLRDYGDTGGGTVVVLDGSANVVSETPFSGDLRHISADGERFLLLTDSLVYAIRRDGVLCAKAGSDGQQAVLCGDTAVVLGLSTLRAYTPEKSPADLT